MKRLVALACLAPLVLAAATPDCSLVPGWKQKGPARTFIADNLFEYMDGNAEGYIIYQFARMQGVTCESGGDTLVIDISDMTDPEFAYGIFTANRDPRRPSEKLGMAAQILPRRAVLVKDRYYVEIAASPEKDHTGVLRQFAAALEKQIAGRTELPEALGWFPEEQLDRESVRLVPESVLGLRVLKRGYVAQYGFGKAFLVREASPEAAAGIMTKLRARTGHSAPAQVADEAFETTDKYLGRMCVFRKGRYVAGFAGLAEGEDATARAALLAARIP